MRRIVTLIVFSVVSFVAGGRARGDDPKAGVRGISIGPGRVTPELLAGWKAKGVTSVVVRLDEATKPRWGVTAEVVERAGMTLWPWIEVGRNPAMADAHPGWMAAIGGHHHDWRSRFPDAPKPRAGEVIKAWPWVPIGYAPAFEAHRDRLKALLDGLPGRWAGVFVNDLQAGPSSCGCGNDQCRWALDYGSPSTAARTPGDDAAARIVAELQARHRGKAVVPVWVTECETIDLPDAKHSTGLCGGVPCAANDCWPRYARHWNPLVKAAEGPIALGLWPATFRRDPDRWIESDLALFQKPPKGGASLPPDRVIAVVQAWDIPATKVDGILRTMQRSGTGWVLALEPIDQSWKPRAVGIDAK
jgi:hypothetical protein